MRECISESRGVDMCSLIKRSDSLADIGLFCAQMGSFAGTGPFCRDMGTFTC